MADKPSYNDLEQKVKELEIAETERKRAEEALQKSEAFRVSLLEHSPNPIIVVNADTSIRYVNPALERLTGYSLAEIKGVEAPFPWWIDDPRSGDMNVRRKSILNGGYSDEVLFQKKNGETFWVEITTTTIIRDGEFKYSLTTWVDITERKYAEEELKKSEAYYKEAQRVAHIGHWELDPEIGTPVWSDEIFHIFGLNPKNAEPSVLNLENYIHPDEWPLLNQAITSANTEGTPYEMSFRIIQPDGTIRWMHSIGTTIKNEKGKVIKQFGTAQDITERKQAEEAIDKRIRYERMLRAVLETVVLYNDIEKILSESLSIIGEALDVSRVYIFEHNYIDETMDNTFEWCANKILPQKEELQGLPSKNLQWWVDTIRENKLIRYNDIENIPDKKVKEILRPQKIKSILVVPIFLKGNYFGFIGFDECMDHREWIDNDVAILKSTTQILAGAIESKQTEEALKESEERLKLALDSVRDAVWDWRVDTGEVYFSSRWYTMLGYKPYELPESFETWRGLLHPDDSSYAEETVSHHLELAKPFELEFRMKTKDDQWKWILARGKTVEKDDQGRALRMLGTHMDITERKRLEAQLQQAQKMESIGTLAGGIAHDFNNILSPIMIHSELATMDLHSDSPVHHNLKEIFKAGERARDLVRQILAFSRKEEGKRVAIKIIPILKEVLKLLRSSIPTTIEIKQNLEAESDTVLADPTQIHQIILNLGTNAAHAMREAGGILEVSLVQEDLDSETAARYSDLAPGSYLKLTVKDTGYGIDNETMQKIFEPYFTTKEIGEGTGMGLALAHGIVKNYGGDITVESELGKGTTFEVYLPKIEDGVESVAEPSVRLPKGSERILFVDDEKVLVDAIKPMLENLGYKVTARTSSIEALEAFKNNPNGFDLVITDMTMPNMTGKELTKEIISIQSNMPIILCSGFSDQIDESRAKEMGISAYLMKPIVMHDMADTIRKVLG